MTPYLLLALSVPLLPLRLAYRSRCVRGAVLIAGTVAIVVPMVVAVMIGDLVAGLWRLAGDDCR